MQRLQPHAYLGAGCQWLRRPIDLNISAPQSPFKALAQVRWATHGAQGIANGPKNGPGKRLGAKKTGDEYVVTGNIIFRQRGTKWFPGENVGMGRDHTIFALEAGYVKYYRDPLKHPKRQYIGVVFEKSQKLPAPPHAARRRRLGMVAVPRKESTSDVHAGKEMGVFSDTTKSGADLAAGHAPVPSIPAMTTKQVRLARKKRQKSGMLPLSELEIRPDYSYRETNWSIGRAAERAGIKVSLFKKGDRFKAWRKKTARLARNAEKRAMVKKKGKKDKAARAGSRTASVTK